MSSKSEQPGGLKKGFSSKMTAIAIIIGLAFLGVIVVYPRIFSPSHLGRNTAPAPIAPASQGH